MSLTGSLCIWFSVILAMGGFGLTLRALEARFGRLSLSEYRGLYEHSPTLAVCFLLTGLASVGFPGTIGFVSAELLVDGAVDANVFAGLAVVVTAAINGIAVMRAYFLLFTGARHGSTVTLGITPRERFAVLTLTALVLGGGIFPQPGVRSRQQAAEKIIRDRANRLRDAEGERLAGPAEIAARRLAAASAPR
jgi:NADH-quinone oxidoreductase subunit M